MCFRPGTVAKPIECPHCKKTIKPMATVALKKCPFCGKELATSDTDK